MGDKSWKAFERRLARDVGNERIPASGRIKDEADFYDDAVAAYQAKLYATVPAYVRDWLNGISETAERIGRIGLLVWKAKGERDDDAVVVMNWRAWRDVVLPSILKRGRVVVLGGDSDPTSLSGSGQEDA